MKRNIFPTLVLIFLLSTPLWPQVIFKATTNTFHLRNRYVAFTLNLADGRPNQETFRALDKRFFHGSLPSFIVHGNFALNINWTGWHAPHKIDNADNPTVLTVKDFKLKTHTIQNLPDGGKQLQLILTSASLPLQIRLTYRLAPKQFWLTKQIAVRDTIFGYHYLRRIYPVYAQTALQGKILKDGGFGQPVVLRDKNGSLFFAIEYPAAHNRITRLAGSTFLLESGLEVGQKIARQWIASPQTVIGLMPAHFERLWFDRYLQSQRVQPLRPYVLYNSWYDLRSPAFKNIPKQNIMNETNILRIIDLIEKNFVQKNGIHLDAFVLDDGWDVYASDWVLRPKQFPHGLKPIANRLQKMGTHLGLWFGPTGGYSFRMRRIKWMGAHGYEVIAKNSDRNHAMMCVAGRHYSQLLKKRTTDFVKNDGVAFFKWDGIQFSCSEPDHGHPIGIYSRRAVMDTVIALCRAVRRVNPQTFLNITSGTWLSPWWVKYANQIWMGGGDYGYSDVPSISRRDAAMTYRDITLFQDMRVRKFWFPIANLMTHGIIKGQLQKLGGEQEPIEKFTNNALLYFARGVSMWELYISPDILSDAEWKAIARSLNWAKHNFNILKHTFIIGGNPAKDSLYAYVHFTGSQGIIALRNPSIAPQTITVPLSDTLGLASDVHNLVLEQIYPVRWIAPQLYNQGQTISLKAQGYETAVYRLFPIEQARRPLPANIIFSGQKVNDRQYRITAYASTGELRMLNPSFSRAMHMPGKKAEHIRFDLPALNKINGLKSYTLSKDQHGFSARLQLAPQATGRLALLLKKDGTHQTAQLPQVQIRVNGRLIRPQVEKEGSKWAWFKIPLNSNEAQVEVTFKNSKAWAGTAGLYFFGDISVAGVPLVFETKKPVENEVLPPLPRAEHLMHKQQQLAQFRIKNDTIVKE